MPRVPPPAAPRPAPLFFFLGLGLGLARLACFPSDDRGVRIDEEGGADVHSGADRRVMRGLLSRDRVRCVALLPVPMFAGRIEALRVRLQLKLLGLRIVHRTISGRQRY